MPTKRLMRKFKKFINRQAGFTILELLLIVAIVGILAVVLVPRISEFYASAEVAGANQEVFNIEKAAMAYYGNTTGTWPPDSDTLFTQGYLNKEANVDYGFDDDGRVTVLLGTTWGNAELVWNDDDHVWQKP